MKITKKILNSIGIRNCWQVSTLDGTEKGNPYITYSPDDNTRGGSGAKWILYRPGYKTDPKNAHWREGYNKVFSVWGRDNKEPKRLEAIDFATQRYGIHEWEKDPFGAYHPKTVMDKLRRLVDESK